MNGGKSKLWGNTTCEKNRYTLSSRNECINLYHSTHICVLSILNSVILPLRVHYLSLKPLNIHFRFTIFHSSIITIRQTLFCDKRSIVQYYTFFYEIVSHYLINFLCWKALTLKVLKMRSTIMNAHRISATIRYICYVLRISKV